MGPGNECRDDSRFVARARLPCARRANAVGVAPGATALVWQARCEAPPTRSSPRPLQNSHPEKQGNITMADARRIYLFDSPMSDCHTTQTVEPSAPHTLDLPTPATPHP